MLLKFAVGWRRYVELFWYAVESAKEHNIMIKIPYMSDQFKAAIVGILVMFAVQFVPQLEPLQDDMTEIASVIIAAIVGKSLVSGGNSGGGDNATG